MYGYTFAASMAADTLHKTTRANECNDKMDVMAFGNTIQIFHRSLV